MEEAPRSFANNLIYPRAVTKVQVVNKVVDAEREGFDAAKGKPERWIEMFDEAAQTCVRDGAETVLCGCNPGGALLALAGYREVRGTGVPVIVGPAAMAKLAESMVDLRRSIGLTKSEAESGAYRTTPPHILEELQAVGKRLLV